MSLRTRITLMLLLSVGVCAVLLAEVWRWRGGLIRIPLPLAGAGGFPVPLLYWSSIAIYTTMYGRFFGITRREQWARAFQLGCSLHFLALLASLAWQMIHNTPSGLSVWYIRYWYAFWGAVVVLGLVGLWRATAHWLSVRTVDPQLFFLPLMSGYVGFWVYACVLAPSVTFGATMVGLGVLAAGRLHSPQVWWMRLKTLMRNERYFLVFVFFLALAFRLFYTTRVMTNPDYLNTGSDGPAYDALAWALVRGVPEPRWGHLPLFAPGYVRFLALIYWLGGRHYGLVCAVQSVIGALVCVLTYVVAKRLFGVQTARIAAVFGALNFLMVFSASAIGHQAVDVWWTLLVVWCLLCYLDHPQRLGRWIVAVGALLGWAAVTREGNIMFWMWLVGWFLIGIRAKLGLRKAIIHVVGLSLGFLVTIAPFALTIEHGSLRFVALGKQGGRVGAQWFVCQHSPVDVHTWFNPWVDPTRATLLLKEHPFQVVANVARAMLGNFSAVFLDQDYGSFDPVFLVRRSLYSYGMWWYAYALAFYGLALVFWGAVRAPIERLGWWLILVVLVSRSVVHLVLEAAYRHRTPLEPFLIMLAAYGFTRILQLGQRHQLQREPQRLPDPVTPVTLGTLSLQGS